MRSMFYLVLFLTCVCSFEVFSLGCFFCLSVSGCLGHFRPCCHSSPLARRHFSLTRVACRAPMYRLKLPMILYSRDHLSFACTGQCEVHLCALMIFFWSSVCVPALQCQDASLSLCLLGVVLEPVASTSFSSHSPCPGPGWSCI